MNGKAVALLAGGALAIAGVGSAVGDLGSDDERASALGEFEIRKDDAADDVDFVDEEGDGDDPRDDSENASRDGDRGEDGPSRAQDPNTGSGDQTGGSQQSWGTGFSGDTGQWRDGTGGDDGSNGGDNSFAAPVADDDDYVAPAPVATPAYDEGGSDDGGSDG